MVVFLVGFALIGFCVYGSLRLNRHAFNRRNVAGVEEFSSYDRMLKTKFVEGAKGIGLGLCGLAGVICFFVGGMMMTK